jgi:predicted DsbA family dithiol-disulfide isomerase
MDATPTKLTIISDYICPWCYICSKRVDQLQEEYELEVSWWPYELHPEIPAEGRHVDQVAGGPRRGQEYRDHLKSYAEEAGVKLVSNRIVANSHRSLELGEFARDRGKFDEMHHALFRAYFEEGRNLSDLDVLCEIAAECELDGDEFRAAAASDQYVELIDRTTALARERGFSSTPTMIIADKMLIPGAQDYQVYADVLNRLGTPRRTPATE